MALKVYERYLAREIFTAVTLVLVAFLMLFAFFDFIGEIQQLGKGGYQLHHAIAYVALTLPGRAYELLPIAVLIGTLYALTQLARHSEITVLRASGLSTSGLLVTLLKQGLLFAILTLVIGEAVAPPAERAAQQLRLQAQSSMVAQEFRSGLWVKDEYNFVNVRDMLPDATLQDIRIYAFDSSNHLKAIREAHTGKYAGDGEWTLSQVEQTLFEGNRAHVERFPTMGWKSALNPDILSVLLVVPEKMSLLNLYHYTRHLEENHQKTDRYDIALWKKLSYPFTALVMMMLALPFGYLQDRMGAVSIKVFAGVMLGIGFHMLNGLFSSLGAINSWPPFWSAITPSLIFLAGASGFLWWTERR
ncbi:MAG TPA: LPS export ABC transporter permease LptG [Rhodocyclaceae bacterium]|nr:LPS export ABC transporter permease LptG [Rhodocyclaceae bacterium]